MFKRIVIDHLPITANGTIFDDFSPGSNLADVKFSKKYIIREGFSALRTILEQEIKSKGSFSSQKYRINIVKELSEKRKIFEAVEHAQKEIKKIILITPNIFLQEKEIFVKEKMLVIKNAEEMLDLFCKKIYEHLAKFWKNYGKI